MPGPLAQLLLWLFIINLGIALGAGLYEHRIVVARWLVSSRDLGTHWHADEARRDDTGRKFWALVTTVPLTLLTLASLVVAWRGRGAFNGWWLAAAFTALAERALTFSYFIPTMVRLMRAPDSPEAVLVAVRWRTVSYLRHAIVLAAWLMSLQAFSLLHRS